MTESKKLWTGHIHLGEKVDFGVFIIASKMMVMVISIGTVLRMVKQQVGLIEVMLAKFHLKY